MIVGWKMFAKSNGGEGKFWFFWFFVFALETNLNNFFLQKYNSFQEWRKNRKTESKEKKN